MTGFMEMNEFLLLLLRGRFIIVSLSYTNAL